MHHRRFSLVSTWIVRSFVVLLSGWLVMGCIPCEDRDYDGFKWGTNCETGTLLDCDDHDDEIYPGATEICDGLDNDCDTIIPPDEIDDDGDQYVECTAWVGSDPGILGDNDCNDALANVNPGITEGPYGELICEDNLDNDCDGQVDGSDDGCVPLEMAPIPEDCFNMGDAFSEGEAEELPVHNVCISEFQMDFYEVTNAEYALCVDAGGCAAPSSTSSYSRAWYYGNPVYDNFPVIYVTREQAATYCAWVGKRLPTEAEWEYAARGGLAGKRYPWGDTLSGSEANYWDSGDPWDNDTSPVGHYPPNGYGLYDVAGNVYEWVSDWLWPNYYQYCVDNGIVNDPPGPPSGSIAVARGGYWGDSADFLRLAWRKHLYPDISDLSTGFRCARGGAYGP